MEFSLANKSVEAYKIAHLCEKKYFQGKSDALDCLQRLLEASIEVSDSTSGFWHFLQPIQTTTWLGIQGKGMPAEEEKQWKEVVNMAYQEDSPTLLHYPASLIPNSQEQDVPLLQWPLFVEGTPLACMVLYRHKDPYLPETFTTLDPICRAAWQIVREVKRGSIEPTQHVLEQENFTNWAGYLEHTDDTYLLVNRSGEVMDASAGSLRLMDRLKTQIITKSLDKFIHPDDRTLFLDKLSQSGREPKLLEARLLLPQGGTRMVQWKFTPHTDPTLWYIMGRDVTLDHHNRQALVKSRSYAEQLIRSLPDGVVLLNPGQVHQDVNPAFEAMTGFTSEELKGYAPPFPYWAEEDMENIETALKKTMQGQFEDFELTFKRKNGERFPALVRPSQLLDGNGEPVTFYATVKDMSQQKLVLEQVKENEYRFRQLVMNSPLAIIIHSEGIVRFCNPAAVHLLEGGNFSQFLGQPLTQFLEDADHRVEDRLKAFSLSDAQATIEEKMRSGKGKPLEVEITSHTVTFEGKPAFQTIIRDITARKKALTDLRESEQRLRFLVESVPHVIWTASEPGQIETCNSSGLQVLRTTMGQILSQGWLPFVHPSDRQRLSGAWNNASIKERSYRVRYRLGNPDQETWRWVQEDAAPMKDDKGRIVRWYGIATDVHEQVLAEAALTKREAFLNSLVQSQTTFLVRLDREGHLQFINEAFRRRFRQTTPLLGKHQDTVLHPEDVEAWEATTNKCAENPGEPYSVQLRMIDQHKQVIWTSWEFVGLSPHTGMVNEIQGVGNDITQQKEAEAILEEERKKLANITNSIPGVVYQFRMLPDGQTTFEFVSKGVYDLFKIDIDHELDLQELFGLMTGADTEEIQASILKSAETLTPWQAEFQIRTKNGDYRWLQGQSMPEPPLADGSVRWNGIVTDITEQKSLKSLLDDTSQIAKVGGWEVLPGASTLKWTEETYRIHELPIGSEISVEKAIEYYSPKYQEEISQAVLESLRVGSPFDVIAQLTTAKGNFKWIRAQGRGIKEGDKITKVYGTIQDITKSHDAQLELRENQAILYTSLEHSLVSNILLDPEGNITFIDTRTAKLFGYLTGNIPEIGDWFPEYLPKYELEAFEEQFNNALKGKTATMERAVKYPSQPTYWVELAFRPVMRDEEHASAVVYSFQDITERKKAEQEIVKLAMVAENTDNLVIITDDKGYIEWVNDAFTELSGYNLEEVAGHQPGLFLFGSGTDQEVVHTIEEAFALHQKVKTELKQYTKQGKPFWVELDMEPIFEANQKVKRFILLENDITERKESEKAIQEQNEELKKTNQELDTFVYRVSHDLRAPLVSSLGLIDLALTEPDDAVVKNYLQLQQKSLQKLDNFIQDILNYSRNSRLEIVSTPINFEELITGIFEQLNYIESFKSIERQIEIKYNSTFLSDHKRLHIVLSNLISNALKFSRPQLQHPFVKASVSGDAEWVEIRIEDNGMGIPENHVNNIFKMFYRATDRQSGSGLGLYIVKETIEKLGGSVEVASKVNVGTTFTILLPNLANK